jgi:hypothetical protein
MNLKMPRVAQHHLNGARAKVVSIPENKKFPNELSNFIPDAK